MTSHPIEAAYFSMEIALEPALPTYAGGLGILAGDTLRSAADMGLPMAGVTLLHRKGYFEQHLDNNGNQSETPSQWEPEKALEPVDARAHVTLEGRQVSIRAWQYAIRGCTGHKVPVFLLDTALPENPDFFQTLTNELYGGDEHYRLCQEAVLGLGGVAMLRQLGHHHLMTYHMNEGHPALLVLALLQEHVAGRPLTEASAEDIDLVRKKCVFTTHTPVPAGHDQFSQEMALGVLGPDRTAALAKAGCLAGNVLNMTDVGL